MPESSVHPLESILRLCAAAAPHPWYPSAYAKETNTPRDTLDPYLDQLRMAGLVHLTDWVPGHGQGYALTPAGEDVLKDPRQLARLLAGKWSLRVVRDDRPQARAAPSPWERGEAVRGALLYPVQPVVTFVLMAICIVLFLIKMQFKEQYQEIFDWASADPFGIVKGQWWRLLTTAFLHQDLIHLVLNMFGLYSLGRVTESIWGHGRHLTIWIIGAIGATCLALITIRQRAIHIGASGALCAIFAGWAAWFFHNRQHLPPSLVIAWQRAFMINLVLLVFISLFPGVSWQGHLGGAIAGLITALWFIRFQPQSVWLRGLQIGGVLLIPIVGLGLVIRTMNTSTAWLEIREEVEKREINGHLSDMGSADQKARRLYSEALEPLLELGASRRKSQDVNKAVGQLDEQIGNLHRQSDLLQRRGPFSTPFVEKARQVRLQLTNAWIALLQMGKECLVKGKDCTEKDEKELRQQEKEVMNINRQWQELLENGSR
jgi:membrane associated rhomboid family serine protease